MSGDPSYSVPSIALPPSSPIQMLFKTKTKTAVEQDGLSSSPTASEKAQIRREQVRKAQRQHRQRKTNYVKQLELDVAQIRNMISATQRETQALRAENDAIRAQLSAPANEDGQPSEASPTFAAVAVGDLDDFTMDLLVDEFMNTPVWQISSTPTSSSFGSSYQSPLPWANSAQLPVPDLKPEQTQQMINFILALEHICWDHFEPATFQPEPGTTAGSGPENGHLLTASSLALRAAPPSVFDAIRETHENMAAAAASTADQTHPTSTAILPNSPVIPSGVSWQVPGGLTLQALYELACAVNPPDVDLTPVQAWFELASRYPVDLLLRPDIESALKREFFGVVKCLHYGAAIEKTAFEGIVARVLNPHMENLLS